MPGKGKRYTAEFKEQAARKVVDNSLPIAQVARELGVNDTTLGFWVKDYRKKHAADPLPADMPDSERIRELERRNRELEMENAFLKKSGSVLREGAAVSEKYLFVDAEYAGEPAAADSAPTVRRRDMRHFRR